MPQKQQINLYTTEACSPTKTITNSFQKNNHLSSTYADDNFMQTFSIAHMHKLNITQKQINSHETIHQILQKNKQNTIHHNVGIIPNQIKLYKVPLQCITNQFNFNAIPPKDNNFVSTSSEKIKQFHCRLSDERQLCERLEYLKEKNMEKIKIKDQTDIMNNRSKNVGNKSKMYNKRPNSVRENVGKRVSLSGLVSYSFNSVTARKTLGSIPDIPQQQALQNKITQIKRRNSCSTDRGTKILSRKLNSHNKNKIQFGKAAISNFQTPTDLFLHSLKKQSVKTKQIYGQRMDKLDCIKQFMQKQKTDFQHARFIVQAILNSKKKEKLQTDKAKEVNQVIDDEKQLAKRKKIFNRKKVMVKHLCFVD